MIYFFDLKKGESDRMTLYTTFLVLSSEVTGEL